MYALNQTEERMSSDYIDALIERVMPIARKIDVTAECTPETVGALNSVAASGGEVSETTVQLLVLRSRGEITEEEYSQLVLHYIDVESDE